MRLSCCCTSYATYLRNELLQVLFLLLAVLSPRVDAAELGHQAFLLLHLISAPSVEEIQLLFAALLVLNVVAKALGEIGAPDLQGSDDQTS